MTSDELARLLDHLEHGRPSRADLVTAISGIGTQAELDRLFSAADRVRKERIGDDVHLRGVIEFSNNCVQNCHYCGLRHDHRGLKRYRMEPVEIEAAALNGVKLGYRTIVLQSGSDLTCYVDTLALIIRRIKKVADVAITLSIGERTYEEYEALRQSGADRFLLKHETADPVLYDALHADTGSSSGAAAERETRLRVPRSVPTGTRPNVVVPRATLQGRLQCLFDLKRLGYQIGSGNMVGLPGQTAESLADDIILLSELEVDMAGIGPFIPNPATPLGQARRPELDDVLKILALTRLVLKDVHLPATTALETLAPGARRRALQCGANVIMPNITPVQYRQYYEIYPDKACLAETPDTCRECVMSMLAGMGRGVPTDHGHSPRRTGGG
ncbi:MAG: radical SAM protein [Planctomycetota bacterium]|nr:radical SAM protein [Planctomycetota bacterium]